MQVIMNCAHQRRLTAQHLTCPIQQVPPESLDPRKRSFIQKKKKMMM